MIEAPLQILPAHPRIVSYRKHPPALCRRGEPFHIELSNGLKSIEKPKDVPLDLSCKGRVGYLLDTNTNQHYLMASIFLDDQPHSLEQHVSLLTRFEGSEYRVFFFHEATCNMRWNQRVDGTIVGTNLFVRVGVAGTNALFEKFGDPNEEGSWLADAILPKTFPGSLRLNTSNHLHLFVEL